MFITTTDIKNLFPRQRTIHCGLIKACNVCIGPHGETYRCEHDFGDESRVIGNICHGRFYNDSEFIYYSTIDSPQKQKCTHCNYLPICIGRCMAHVINNYEGFDCKAFQQLQFKLKILEGGVN